MANKLQTRQAGGDMLAALPVAAAILRLRKAKAAPPPPPPDTVLEWAERYRQIEDRPFSLDRFRPLREIYEDDHPHIVVIKPAQRGVSEWAINYACFALDQGAEAWTGGEKNGLNVAYIFPTLEALGDFSKERISGIQDESEHLRRLFSGEGDFNAVRFKQAGDSYLYLRGGHSEKALKSFPADVVIIDEFDEAVPKAIALVRRRMNASIVRREVNLSTPTVPGRGIHSMYLQSDQRVYQQLCWSCRVWRSFDFFRDVRVDNLLYAEWSRLDPDQIRARPVTLHCPECFVEVSDEERCSDGRWFAEAPERDDIHGYWIPWWAFPVVNLREYAASAVSSDPSEVEEFFRSDLGVPYGVDGSSVTESQLRQLYADLPGGQLPGDLTYDRTTMGVDVGARFHYRVSSTGSDGRRYVRAMGSVASWSEVDGLMSEWGVSLAIVDAQPELHGAAAFVERFPGRAVAATYPTGANALRANLYAPTRDLVMSSRRIQVNRTMAMDLVYAAINQLQERWPAHLVEAPETLAHLTSPTRVLVIDKHGQTRADWVHTRPDHLFHACVYDLLAYTMAPPPAASGSSPPPKGGYHAPRRHLI